MASSGGGQASLCAWLGTLPERVLARYMLELRGFDRGLTGVLSAIELIRAEFRTRELGASYEAIGHTPESEAATPDIKGLIDRCRAQQEHTVDLRARSMAAIARLEAALGFVEPATVA
jgi:hypothetical protein